VATQKQKQTIKNLSENIGIPIGQAMLKAGYSKSTSETPSLLTNSKGWRELLDDVLPDSLLVEKHLQLLNNNDPFVAGNALNMAYKLKNKYTAKKFSFVDPLDDLSDEQIDQQIEELKAKLNLQRKPSTGNDKLK
jgi:hypothetical protein